MHVNILRLIVTFNIGERVYGLFMNQIKVVFLALIVVVVCLLLEFTPDVFRPMVKKHLQPEMLDSQVIKHKLTQTTDVLPDINRIQEGEELHKIPIFTSTKKDPSSHTDTRTTDMTISMKDGESTQSKYTQSEEVTHIEFLKVHKAASSTVQGIILRFALKRNLSVVIPTPSHYLSQRKVFFSDIWPHLPKPNDKADNEKPSVDTEKCSEAKYDILTHHMVFNYKKVSKLLHGDSVYIGIVREPLEQFLSAAYYYKYVQQFPYLKRLRNDTFITDLIRKPEQFEATAMTATKTFNSMTYDFGFDFTMPSGLKGFDNMTDEGFGEFLNDTADIFHLVMVVEQFEESLILLKRYLKWPLKDIVYLKLNTLSSQVEKDTLATRAMTANDKQLFRKRNKLDYALYQYFKNRLKEQISREEIFDEEVTNFKAVLKNVETFCSNENTKRLNKIPSTAFSETDNDVSNAVADSQVKTPNEDKNVVTAFNKTDDSTSATMVDIENEINEIKHKEGNTRGLRKQTNNTDISRINTLLGQKQTRHQKSKETKVFDMQTLIETLIKTKNLSNSQEAELWQLGKLVHAGTLRIQTNKLSKILDLILRNKGTPYETDLKLVVPHSKWNNEFSVTSSDCDLMSMDLMLLYEVVKQRHLELLIHRKFSESFSVIEAVKYISDFF